MYVSSYISISMYIDRYRSTYLLTVSERVFIAELHRQTYFPAALSQLLRNNIASK